jgi:hypothetical protein
VINHALVRILSHSDTIYPVFFQKVNLVNLFIIMAESIISFKFKSEQEDGTNLNHLQSMLSWKLISKTSFRRYDGYGGGNVQHQEGFLELYQDYTFKSFAKDDYWDRDGSYSYTHTAEVYGYYEIHGDNLSLIPTRLFVNGRGLSDYEISQKKIVTSSLAPMIWINYESGNLGSFLLDRSSIYYTIEPGI